VYVDEAGVNNRFIENKDEIQEEKNYMVVFLEKSGRE
jgi:hypothetical protein